MAESRTAPIEQELAQLLERESFPPPEAFAARARLTDDALHREAAADPVAWWHAQARERLDWIVEPQEALDDAEPPFFRWFADGRLNASAQCVDRHVEAGNGDRVAIRWRGEEGESEDWTYAELLAQVERAANALKARGIRAGDVVGIFLPMIPEVVVAMLACARIGAPHNVVFGGFSPGSVVERMEVSGAKALITADGARRKGKTAPIKEAVDEVIGGAPSVETIFVVDRTPAGAPMTEGRDVVWSEALAAAEERCPPEELEAEHPLFILYSSGSTAKPKGIVHSTGGYMTGVATTFDEVFDHRPGEDVFFCSADVGWITGHSYIVYGPLSNGATTVMYEGAPDYPHKGAWWEVAQETGATIFYTAPTAIRAAMKWGVEHVDRYDLSKLRLLGSVGEPINPKAWAWYWRVVGGGRCPIVDTWWQTETGAIMVTTLPGAQATKPGLAGLPLPGCAVAVLDEEGQEVPDGEQGLLAITQPVPSMLRTLWQDPDRYVDTYWSRFGPRTYFVGDAARKDDDGYVRVIGRVDDVINVSGHRLSTAEVEAAIGSHPKVAEAAVIGRDDEDTGQAIAAFVILEGDDEGDEALVGELREHVAGRIGKLARPAQVVFADDLPKTRSGKIMRRLLRDAAEGREMGDVSTLRDPGVMADIQERIRAASA